MSLIDHDEKDHHIERFIRYAARMLAFGYDEERCVTDLQAVGASLDEAHNATAAGKLLNEWADKERTP